MLSMVLLIVASFICVAQEVERNSTSPLEITSIEPLSITETVTIRNNSDTPINLGGWTLTAGRIGYRKSYSLIFPGGCTLQAGATITVRSGPSNLGKHDHVCNSSTGEVIWEAGFIWPNDEGLATLRTPQGDVVSYRIYPFPLVTLPPPPSYEIPESITEAIRNSISADEQCTLDGAFSVALATKSAGFGLFKQIRWAFGKEIAQRAVVGNLDSLRIYQTIQYLYSALDAVLSETPGLLPDQPPVPNYRKISEISKKVVGAAAWVSNPGQHWLDSDGTLSIFTTQLAENVFSISIKNESPLMFLSNPFFEVPLPVSVLLDIFKLSIIANLAIDISTMVVEHLFRFPEFSFSQIPSTSCLLISNDMFEEAWKLQE